MAERPIHQHHKHHHHLNTHHSQGAGNSNSHSKKWAFPTVIPKFPELPGPYHVGTLEVEIPVSSLMEGLKEGEGLKIKVENKEQKLETVLFRIFYPSIKPGQRRGNPSGTASGDQSGATTPNSSEQLKKEMAAEGKEGPGWAEYIKEKLRWKGGVSQNKRMPAKPVYWVPEPFQREFFKGYLRFGGLSREWLIEMISRFPQLVYHITIPATSNSPLIDPLPTSKSSRFPTMIFSHGLGGSQLAYSHICSSIASHGLVVIAPEHRDGSGPVSIIRKRAPPQPVSTTATAAEQKNEIKIESVDYVNIPHDLDELVSLGRDFQLSIRCMELSLVHTALTQFDKGIVPKGTLFGPEGTENIDEVGGEGEGLAAFKDKLDILEPGRVVWAGHSFGAATMVQFIKSVYYSSPAEGGDASSSQLPLPPPSYTPLFKPAPSQTPLKQQITPKSPLLLLDLWSLSLLGSKRTYWLWKKPLPQILPQSPESSSPSGTRLLTILSSQFQIWKENLWAVKWVLSRNPALRNGAVKGALGYDPSSGKDDDDAATDREADSASSSSIPAPNPKLFYAQQSAHLTQSDFGILFPYFFRSKVPDPHTVMNFNIRAIMQWLREAGYADDLSGERDELIFGEEEGGEDKNEDKDKEVIKGWWRLSLAEERIGKEKVEKAVEEGLGAGGEGDLAEEGGAEGEWEQGSRAGSGDEREGGKL